MCQFQGAYHLSEQVNRISRSKIECVTSAELSRELFMTKLVILPQGIQFGQKHFSVWKNSRVHLQTS